MMEDVLIESFETACNCLHDFMTSCDESSMMGIFLVLKCSCTRMNGAATQCSAGEKRTPSLLLFQLQVQRNEQFAFDSWTRKNMEIRFFLQCTAASTFDLDLDRFDRRSVGSTDQGGDQIQVCLR
jgi:hypothetical protein